MRNIGQARGAGAFIEHGFDAETPSLLGDIRLIDRAQFFDPAGQAIEVDRADPAAFGQHAVEHRDMRVQLRIGRLQRHFAHVGVGPAFLVAPLDLGRGSCGVVLKADPAESAGFDAIRPALAFAGKAELGLGIGHRLGDSPAVDLEQRRAFGLGRRQCPGDRQRFVGRERHVDKADGRPCRVNLPAVIRRIEQPASRELAIR